MNFLGYHRDCGGRVRQTFRDHYIADICSRCAIKVTKTDILEINPMPKIIHQKSSGVQIKRKYYDNMRTE